ncbi:hypothetical protein DENSPDRAFT_193382 [Dentipellis sp. KUC8613]|nr:hypothetical protein DENSPDRAFT_193382 [Dentipellis sp. KUC8613]
MASNTISDTSTAPTSRARHAVGLDQQKKDVYEALASHPALKYSRPPTPVEPKLESLDYCNLWKYPKDLAVLYDVTLYGSVGLRAKIMILTLWVIVQTLNMQQKPDIVALVSQAVASGLPQGRYIGNYQEFMKDLAEILLTPLPESLNTVLNATRSRISTNSASHALTPSLENLLGGDGCLQYDVTEAPSILLYSQGFEIIRPVNSVTKLLMEWFVSHLFVGNRVTNIHELRDNACWNGFLPQPNGLILRNTQPKNDDKTQHPSRKKKVGRRLSSRVIGIFKPTKSPSGTPAESLMAADNAGSQGGASMSDPLQLFHTPAPPGTSTEQFVFLNNLDGASDAPARPGFTRSHSSEVSAKQARVSHSHAPKTSTERGEPAAESSSNSPPAPLSPIPEKGTATLHPNAPSTTEVEVEPPSPVTDPQMTSAALNEPASLVFPPPGSSDDPPGRSDSLYSMLSDSASTKTAFTQLLNGTTAIYRPPAPTVDSGETRKSTAPQSSRNAAHATLLQHVRSRCGQYQQLTSPRSRRLLVYFALALHPILEHTLDEPRWAPDQPEGKRYSLILARFPDLDLLPEKLLVDGSPSTYALQRARTMLALLLVIGRRLPESQVASLVSGAVEAGLTRVQIEGTPVAAADKKPESLAPVYQILCTLPEAIGELAAQIPPHPHPMVARGGSEALAEEFLHDDDVMNLPNRVLLAVGGGGSDDGDGDDDGAQRYLYDVKKQPSALLQTQTVALVPRTRLTHKILTQLVDNFALGSWDITSLATSPAQSPPASPMPAESTATPLGGRKSAAPSRRGSANLLGTRESL